MENNIRILDTKLILAILATGIMSFSGIVVETAMNVTFPILMQEFSISTDLVQWITTAYLLVLAMIIPLSTYLKKKYPAKMLFVTAILFFITGTVFCAIAGSFWLLILGRVIQGIGTGIALPMMFNIVLEQVPGEKLGLMIGIATLIVAMAPAVGPSLGGMLVKYFGWRMIFIALLPFLFLSFGLGAATIRQVTPLASTGFNWLAYLLMAISFCSFIFATSLTAAYGWLSYQVIFLFCLSLLSIAIFYRLSLSASRALLHVEVFHYSAFNLSFISLILIQFICLGLGFLIPNYAQIVLHTDPFIAGCLLLPGCILGAMLAPVSGKLLDRLGPKKPILLGNASIIIATLSFSLFSYQLTNKLFMIFYLFFAFGQGFSMGTIMANSINQLPKELHADGNAVINTLQQLAGAIGTSVITSIVATAQANKALLLTQSTLIGSSHAFYLLIGLAVCALICSLRVFQFNKA